MNNLAKDVDDWTPPISLDYNTPTIFDVLQDLGITCKVYADSVGTPTLTRSQFVTHLGSPRLQGYSRGLTDFCNDDAPGTLPSYSFAEPNFLERKNDQHPPHDVPAGDKVLKAIVDGLDKERAAAAAGISAANLAARIPSNAVTPLIDRFAVEMLPGDHGANDA